jgi:hypothetical protein
MIPSHKVVRTALLALIAAGTLRAQYRGGGFRGEDFGPIIRLEGGGWVNEDTVRTARETASHSTETPNWTNPVGFERDVVTFARIVFKSTPRNGGGIRTLGWYVDYPDADLNFSYRLQELTSAKTDPDGRVLHLTDADLVDFPFIYMEHVEGMTLGAGEIAALRKYLLNGGALMINDFWNVHAWENLAAEMQRVLPGRSWVDLPMDHPLFNCVYHLAGPLQKLQVPTLQFWNRDYDPKDPTSPLSLRNRGEGSEEVHVRALLDDRQRIMVIAVHNSDIPDGWEREGENIDYFQQFSEKISYPFGINIMFYLMTH